LIYGCLEKGAIQTDVTGVDAQNLEQVVENNNNIDELETLKQQLAEINLKYQKMIEAETINYGGAGWVIVGMSIVLVIFLIVAAIVIKRIYGNAVKNENLIDKIMLSIANAPPDIQKIIKDSIDNQTPAKTMTEMNSNKDVKDFIDQTGRFKQ
jgi:hypothetical protein